MQNPTAYHKAVAYVKKKSQTLGSTKDFLPPGPCITISRETGAGAEGVSENIVKFFERRDEERDWAAFDKNLIERVIHDNNLPSSVAKYLSEETTSHLDSAISELLGLHPPMGSLIRKTSKSILKLAYAGSVVIVGRGSSIIASGLKNGFHIRLVAPFELRVERISEIFNIDEKSAKEFVIKEDAARKSFVLKYFKRDNSDPLLYNLVINTGKFTYEQVAEIAGNATIQAFPHLFSKIHN